MVDEEAAGANGARACLVQEAAENRSLNAKCRMQNAEFGRFFSIPPCALRKAHALFQRPASATTTTPWQSWTSHACQARRVVDILEPDWGILMDTTSPDVTEEPLVLIVEDDPATRALYRDGLHQAGFRTIEAHNGLQALDKAQAALPHVVLTDVAVPGMDGFEFGRALRELDPTRTIPILAVTGRSEYLDEPDRFRHAGIARVLLKPCDPDRLARELRELLDQHPAPGTRADEGSAV